MTNLTIAVAGGMYLSSDGRAAVQEAINCYPVVVEASGRSRYVQVPTPGITAALTGLDGPCRALLFVDGLLFGVFGTRLYRWDGTTNVDVGELPGAGRLSFAYSDDHIAFVNDLFDAWVYDLTGASLAQVVDVDLPPVSGVTFLDGYFIYTKAGSRQFYLSALNDPLTIDGLDFATKEGDPDPIRATISNHGDLIILGWSHIEYWRNAGSGLFAFQPLQGTEADRGCAARDSVVELSNTVLFLGDDRVVYRIAGYQPVRVSDHGIEEILRGMTDDQIEAAYAQGYDNGGHYHYALTVGSRTLTFDMTSSALAQQNLWHERRSHRAGEGLTSPRPWRASYLVRAFGLDYAGDLYDGSLGVLDRTVHTEYGLRMRSQRTLAPIFNEGDSVSHQRLELRMREGIGAIDTDPWVELQWSNDGGRTWSDPKPRTMGKQGAYKTRCIWRRLGSAVDRIYRFSATDAPGFSWVSAVLDAEPRI